ncbi:MAG: VCBS repeat-containing protein [Planctomycetaceae bacterium]|nr:VCBS repeat-containing protein [Planctomycetaceae bacterium]
MIPRPRVVRCGRVAILILVFGMVACLVAWWSITSARSPGAMLAKAGDAFAKEDFLTARDLARQLLRRHPKNVEALLVDARSSLALGRCTDAEQSFEKVLSCDGAVDAACIEAHLSLIRLMKMQGRYYDLQSHAEALLRSGDSGNEFLIPLAAPDGITLTEAEFSQAQFCRAAAPDDMSSLLGPARYLQWNSELKQAREILEQIIQDAPHNIEAQAQLGTNLLQQDDRSAFLLWLNQLPETAETHPEIWFLKGSWAVRQKQLNSAIRCFGEALLRDPNHRRANFSMAQALVMSGEPQSATTFTNRFEQLEEVARLATRGNDLSNSTISAETMYRIASLMLELGRLWEAAAWCQQALKRDPQKGVSQPSLLDQAQRPAPSTPLTLPKSQPLSHFDLASYPLVAFRDVSGNSVEFTAATGNMPPENMAAEQESQVSFRDISQSHGLLFRFQNGNDVESGLARMFEFSGGGVGVTDLDGDLWPDLYLTQGTTWPPPSAKYRDGLFRNLRGQQFLDCTSGSSLGDDAYSQGPSIGDFDNDGFADLALANIGANRLYHNNGDGTFTDITIDAGIVGDVWTSGCVLADLNGDTFPDLYHVNYLGGDDVYTRRCDRQGRPIQCPLQYFPSEQDQLLMNQGDGQFLDVTGESGITHPEGKGLGVVAADFDGSGQLSLFVANDDKPNFFFVPDGMTSGVTRTFSEQGVSSGLAFGSLGDAQSCMGVAVADTNHDGRLDVFVTNFTNEPNNFYLQQSGLFFIDCAAQAGLELPGLRYMGWGTQFLDANLDGLPDLIVANGHLDQNTAGNMPYQMPTQFFQNLDGNRFVERSARSLGPYFEKMHAGRAIARVDWNRDGATDVCVTHVDDPVALLENHTSSLGHYLTIHLRGLHCSRDAIGSRVRISAGEKVWYNHLTAGDGFQASNQKQLTFGFGDLQHIDQLEIHWPSGIVQTLAAPALDQELLIVEGRPLRILPD